MFGGPASEQQAQSDMDGDCGPEERSSWSTRHAEIAEVESGESSVEEYSPARAFDVSTSGPAGATESKQSDSGGATQNGAGALDRRPKEEPNDELGKDQQNETRPGLRRGGDCERA